MMHLDLRPSASASPPGDFGGKRQGNVLVLPQPVLTALERLAIRNGVEFVSYLHSFPSSVASALGWSLDEVLQARAKLIDQLRGVLPEEILKPASAPARGFGGLPPAVADAIKRH